ncbi:TPA: SDR family NAD(P)-dependent oxidoreductase [Serratia marcescens]|nr:SDR family NAD(P)-dependent oxidoreductase [Serratia marcescens]
MELLRFDGKVAIVTGAGRGLGRSHALLLASRGAFVVVNDLPTEDSEKSPAESVVEEIIAAGGIAIANHDDICTDAENIVKSAIDAFGRLDIVVNNAGINKLAKFGPDAVDSFRQHMEVNFMGTVAVTAAAWPHLIKSGAGRVVNTCSPTIGGFEHQTPYVSSKGAIFTFTRTLAIEAMEHGILINAIAPSAVTRMASAVDIPDNVKKLLEIDMTPEMVTPMVVYLSHKKCSITGETLLTQGGLMQRYALSINRGYMNKKTTPEDIQQNLTAILEQSTSKVVDQIGPNGQGSFLRMFDNWS